MKIGNVSINVDEAYKMGKDAFMSSVNNTTIDKEVIWSEIEKNATKSSTDERPFEHKKPSRKSK